MPYRKPNGGSDTELDVEHELPSAEDDSATSPGTAREDGSKVTSVPAAELESELEKARQQCAAYLDRAARIQAEFDNFRKRNAREQQDYREYALADALKTLLPILDSLDRALKTGAASLEEYRSGIELIDRQFHDALAKLGVQPVPAEGESFDPNLHQAVQMVDTAESPDNTVIDELQRGYKLKDRLLRPAMVRVARNSKG
ncbi:MAG TPA: nucleotide exchange factor GrpE [Terriglobales bacterium]|nr:nucleotide exchange factor GrpE [Terriglobales bacterium]